jgi:hypothetical protein
VLSHFGVLSGQVASLIESGGTWSISAKIFSTRPDIDTPHDPARITATHGLEWQLRKAAAIALGCAERF